MAIWKRSDRKHNPWRADFPHPVTHERVTAPHGFPTKAQAQQWRDTELAKIRNSAGRYRPGSGRVKFGDFLRDVCQPQRNVARSTAGRDRSLLPRLERWDAWPLDEIRPSQVRAWAKQLGESETPHVAEKTLIMFRGVLSLAVADGVLVANPAEDASVPSPPPHEDRILTDAEVSAIVASMPWHGYAVFTETLARTGLRWSECAALPARLVDVDTLTVHVRWTMEKDGTLKQLLKGSSAAYRDVPLTESLAAALQDWDATRTAAPWHDAGGAFMFSGRHWKRLGYDNFNARIWKPAVKASGIAAPAPTPHDLRHFFGTKLGAAGVGESNIAALLGHSPNSRITRRYVQPTASRLAQARAVLS